jgi:hypothetical protein
MYFQKTKLLVHTASEAQNRSGYYFILFERTTAAHPEEQQIWRNNDNKHKVAMRSQN